MGKTYSKVKKYEKKLGREQSREEENSKDLESKTKEEDNKVNEILKELETKTKEQVEKILNEEESSTQQQKEVQEELNERKDKDKHRKSIFGYIKQYGPKEGLGRYFEKRKLRKEREKIEKNSKEIEIIDSNQQNEKQFNNDLYKTPDIAEGEAIYFIDTKEKANKGLKNNVYNFFNNMYGKVKNTIKSIFKNDQKLLGEGNSIEKDVEQSTGTIENNKHAESNIKIDYKGRNKATITVNGKKIKLKATKKDKTKMKGLIGRAKKEKIKPSNTKVKRIVGRLSVLALSSILLVGSNIVRGAVYNKLIKNNYQQETTLNDNNKNFADEIHNITFKQRNKLEEIQVKTQETHKNDYRQEQENVQKPEMVNFRDELIEALNLGIGSKFKMEEGKVTGISDGSGDIGNYKNTKVKNFEIGMIAVYDEKGSIIETFDKGETIAQIKAKYPNAILKYAPKVENASEPIGWDQESARVEDAIINEAIMNLDLTLEDKIELVSGRETGEIDRNGETLEKIRNVSRQQQDIESYDLEL